jgi:hypothetical protein
MKDLYRRLIAGLVFGFVVIPVLTLLGDIRSVTADLVGLTPHTHITQARNQDL